MADYPRYAIYHARAPGSDLDRFGAQLLGYDAHSGEDLPFPNDVIRMALDWRDLTKDPRKYGFHATLKAPISLAPGKTETELLAACERFAGKTPANSAHYAYGRFDQRLYRGRACRAVARSGAACRRLHLRIRFVPRAAYTRGSCAAKSF